MKKVYFNEVKEEDAIIVEKHLQRNSKELIYFTGPKYPSAVMFSINDDYLSILDREDNELIGIISCNRDGYETISHSLYILEEHRKKEYGIAAVIELLKNQFENTSANKSRICIYDGNVSSMKLHKSLGYIMEAALKDFAKIDNKMRNLIYYTVTAEDYAKASKEYIERKEIKEHQEDKLLSKKKGDAALKKLLEDHDVTPDQLREVLDGKDNNSNKQE